jgi:hypothetical protein
MSESVHLAWQTEVVEIPLVRILPMRPFDDSIRKTAKYKCIAASIRASAARPGRCRFAWQWARTGRLLGRRVD